MPKQTSGYPSRPQATRMRGLTPRDIRFTLNGKPVIVQNADPRESLLGYLRSSRVGLTGTKLSCGEGGCGACTVTLAYYDSDTREVVERPINACLRPLCSVDGMAVTTVEGIGTSRNLNPIQRRIAEYNGSQCGFCTPGFVMSMYGLLRRGPMPSHQDVENQFDGNLCRCTGFRPILDAMHSFVGNDNAVVKAVGARHTSSLFARPRELVCRGADHEWHRVLKISDALALLSRYKKGTVALVNGNTSTGIYKPSRTSPRVLIDISQVRELRRIEYSKADRRLTVGGGVTFDALLELLDREIAMETGNTQRVLTTIRDHVQRIAGRQVRSVATVGGNVALVMAHANDERPFPSDLFTVLATFGAEIELRVPARPEIPYSVPILEFPQSDTFPNGYLISAVSIPLPGEDEYVITYKVARRPQNAHALVNAGFLACFARDSTVAHCRLVFGGLGSIARAAHRTEALLQSRMWTEDTLHAAIRSLDEELPELLVPMPEVGVADSYRLALARNLFYKFFLATALERKSTTIAARYRSGGQVFARPISSGQHGLLPAPYAIGPEVHLASPEIAVRSAGTTGPPKMLRSVGPSFPLDRPPQRTAVNARRIAEALSSGSTAAIADVSSAPMTKIGAALQATGEAKYTQDLWPSDQTLEGHFVLSQRPFARFSFTKSPRGLLVELQADFPGVCGFITSADIPNPARSDGYDVADPGRYDPVFANGIVTAVGQPIALVVASDARTATFAADAAQQYITYDTQGLPAALFSIAAAVAAESFLHSSKGHLDRLTRTGSDEAWLANPAPVAGETQVSGRQATGAQAHFYMETQTAVAVPSEGDQLILYASSQHLGRCQEAVATALGLPVANVDARALRLGGGFGGKELRPSYFAVAAAVAAWTLRCPVRIALDRSTDMRMVGKRHPFEGHYTLSADGAGKITRFKTEFLADAGFSYDCTLPVTDLVLFTADAAYNIPTFGVSRQACRTNLPSNTAMRSFGVIQGTLIVEDALERLAVALNLPAETLRERNLYQDSTAETQDLTPYGQALVDCRLHQVWTDFRRVTDFDRRVEEVQAFNQANRWRKRGIAMIPIKYGISYTYLPSNQGGAYVIAFESDGTVFIRHGGVEMGQGIHTKIARLAADALGVDIKYVRVGGTDTLDIPNAPSTGASTGTDLSGGAVVQACGELRQRLEEFCSAYPNLAPKTWRTQWSDEWKAILQAAFNARVDLSAQALYSSPFLGEYGPDGHLKNKGDRLFYYFTYSAAVSEVEIDVLTGESTIRRSDVVYDCGKTINSTLDYGQIEGGFIQGVGNVTTEQIYTSDDGHLLADGTWSYKIPCSKSIPIEFNVSLLDYVPTPGAKTPLDTYGIHSAKSTGEPPLVLACSVFFAIKRAVFAARRETSAGDWFDLDAPATAERIQSACLVESAALKLGPRV